MNEELNIIYLKYKKYKQKYLELHNKNNNYIGGGTSTVPPRLHQYNIKFVGMDEDNGVVIRVPDLENFQSQIKDLYAARVNLYPYICTHDYMFINKRVDEGYNEVTAASYFRDPSKPVYIAGKLLYTIIHKETGDTLSTNGSIYSDKLSPFHNLTLSNNIYIIKQNGHVLYSLFQLNKTHKKIHVYHNFECDSYPEIYYLTYDPTTYNKHTSLVTLLNNSKTSNRTPVPYVFSPTHMGNVIDMTVQFIPFLLGILERLPSDLSISNLQIVLTCLQERWDIIKRFSTKLYIEQFLDFIYRFDKLHERTTISKTYLFSIIPERPSQTFDLLSLLNCKNKEGEDIKHHIIKDIVSYNPYLVCFLNDEYYKLISSIICQYKNFKANGFHSKCETYRKIIY